jgi:hypothetical protein
MLAKASIQRPPPVVMLEARRPKHLGRYGGISLAFSPFH